MRLIVYKLLYAEMFPKAEYVCPPKKSAQNLGFSNYLIKTVTLVTDGNI